MDKVIFGLQHPRVAVMQGSPLNGAAKTLRLVQEVAAPPSPGPQLYPTSPEGWKGYRPDILFAAS